jgi:hypothetical protein
MFLKGQVQKTRLLRGQVQHQLRIVLGCIKARFAQDAVLQTLLRSRFAARLGGVGVCSDKIKAHVASKGRQTIFILMMH